MSNRNFPGFDHLYVLGNPLHDRYFRGHEDTDLLVMFQYWRTCAIPHHPIIVRHKQGGKVPGDVFWSTSHGMYISPGVRQLLQDQGVTGWITFPAQVYSRSGELIEGYDGLAVTGRCGHIVYDRGPIVPIPLGGYYYVGIWFEPESWDGSDWFCGDRGGPYFVTERVKRVFADHKIRNVEFTRLSEVEISRVAAEASLPHE